MTMELHQTIFRLMGFVGQHVEICNTNTRTTIQNTNNSMKAAEKIIEQGLQGWPLLISKDPTNNHKTGKH